MTLNILDDYWQRFAGVEANRLAAKRRAEVIVQTCGWGHVLDIGCGDGSLVRELIERGFVADGVDSSQVAIAYARAHSRAPFTQECLPYLSASAASVDIISIANVLENLDESKISGALAELWRVTKRHLIAWVACDVPAPIIQTRRPRAWWESRLLDAGFRVGMRAFNVPSSDTYGGASREILVMEKCPALDCDLDDSEALIDPTTWPTKFSDIPVRRRYSAAQLIREGDRVLDLSCGTGWGTHILAANSLASEIIGIDSNENAIEYARKAFFATSGLDFVCETPIQHLNRTTDEAVDFIFDARGDAGHTDFLQECHRVLTPGGRVFVLANTHQRDTVEDPNWAESAGFFVEHTFPGLATTPDSSRVEPDVVPILLTKDPLSGIGKPIQRAIAPYVLDSQLPPLLDFNAQYENPWLIRNMISIGLRTFNENLLDVVATRVIESNRGTNDIAAATCVRAYAFLAAGDQPLAKVTEIVNEINARIVELEAMKADAGGYPRWEISLHYVKALIHLKIGERELASENLNACISLPYKNYSILLGTKVASASYLLGLMRIADGNITSARHAWEAGMNVGKTATDIRWEREFGQFPIPPDFVFRELTTILDLATRCTTALQQCREGAMPPVNSLRSVVNRQWLYDKLHQQLSDKEMEMQATVAKLQKATADSAKEIRRLDSLSKAKDEQIRQLKFLLASVQ